MPQIKSTDTVQLKTYFIWNNKKYVKNIDKKCKNISHFKKGKTSYDYLHYSLEELNLKEIKVGLLVNLFLIYLFLKTHI